MVEAVLAQFSAGNDLDLAEILAADKRARELAGEQCSRMKTRLDMFDYTV
ncbi:hypothetical protein VU05_03800 [Desulfobulbus sp. F1]|nr:hypothetical protein [Desulfobulbus sp. F1]